MKKDFLTKLKGYFASSKRINKKQLNNDKEVLPNVKKNMEVFYINMDLSEEELDSMNWTLLINRMHELGGTEYLPMPCLITKESASLKVVRKARTIYNKLLTAEFSRQCSLTDYQNFRYQSIKVASGNFISCAEGKLEYVLGTLNVTKPSNSEDISLREYPSLDGENGIYPKGSVKRTHLGSWYEIDIPRKMSLNKED